MSDLEIIAEPGRQDIVVKRSFDAPRDVVFRAMTEPEHLAAWWGLATSETVIDHADPRTGGSWRFVEKAGGEEYAFRGVYHEVTAPERVVQTFEFEGMPGHVAMETMTLEESGDGRTLYTNVSVYQSVEDRDGMVASGMETGLSQSLDALDGLLRKLA
ncbi:SRPBCC family protein [Nocardiopsis sp. CC223A]|uniref:SRPBCC family protein n=1 Tax=Nocardiopsis sp. CC223A TaxID=3044051 RepID=UPI0027960115|nr:SRPBCC family protein [Nocardiopsis sp. CC223A]